MSRVLNDCRSEGMMEISCVILIDDWNVLFSPIPSNAARYRSPTPTTMLPLSIVPVVITPSCVCC